jgi:hypothetical protein
MAGGTGLIDCRNFTIFIVISLILQIVGFGFLFGMIAYQSGEYETLSFLNGLYVPDLTLNGSSALELAVYQIAESKVTKLDDVNDPNYDGNNLRKYFWPNIDMACYLYDYGINDLVTATPQVYLTWPNTEIGIVSVEVVGPSSQVLPVRLTWAILGVLMTFFSLIGLVIFAIYRTEEGTSELFIPQYLYMLLLASFQIVTVCVVFGLQGGMSFQSYFLWCGSYGGLYLYYWLNQLENAALSQGNNNNKSNDYDLDKKPLNNKPQPQIITDQILGNTMTFLLVFISSQLALSISLIIKTYNYGKGSKISSLIPLTMQVGNNAATQGYVWFIVLFYFAVLISVFVVLETLNKIQLNGLSKPRLFVYSYDGFSAYLLTYTIDLKFKEIKLYSKKSLYFLYDIGILIASLMYFISAFVLWNASSIPVNYNCGLI